MERNIKKVGSKVKAKHYEGNNFIEKEFKIKEVLGEGRSSTVYLVEYIEDEIYVKLGILKEFNPIDKGEREDEFLDAYKKQIEFISKIEDGINITTKAEGIYRTENELYILMEINKGQIYSDVVEKDLESLIKTIIAISKGIGVYHKKGYVHLDIKPENILILDETREIIKLFDFDSIQKLEELEFDRLLCTKSWAAPELLYLEKSFNIGYETDIYSIGIILFNKIFNRFPNRKEQNIFSNIKFDKENNLFDGISPKIFNVLNNFFRKTININSKLRFKNIDEMLEELDKILKISKKDNKILIDIRWAKFEKAMGREKEKEYIHKLLKERGTVFIKGIGGIGKTELVKMYVDEYGRKYDTVQFITFNENLKSTIAKEIKYSNLDDYEYIKKNDIDFLFEEKLKLLNMEEEKTLIIIDNFNVDYDEKLELFIKRRLEGYKLIVTTRNFSEEFEELYLNLNPLEEELAKKLFLKLYNSRNIKDEEKKDISELLKIIGYNTLMIKLIALNCKGQRRKPKVILEKLKSGKITEIDGKIRHGDIGKLMHEHLNTVFQVIDLKKNYKLILKTMSLIGTIKINASFFKELMELENFDGINELVYLGWLELDIERDMLYLHEVISSVINEKLQPTDIECRRFIDNLTKKLKEENTVYKIRRIYFDFAKKIEERLKIESTIGGEFLIVLANQTIENKSAKKYIVKAEKIYIKDKGIERVYLLYIKFYLERLCSIDFFEKGKKVLLKIKKYERKLLNENREIEVENYRKLRKIYTNSLCSANLFLTEKECLEYAIHIEELFLKEESEREKIKDKQGLLILYEEIGWFYRDFSNPIQNERKEKLYEIKSKGEEISEDDLLDLGSAARMDGDMEEALEYYKLSIKIKENYFRADAYENILNIYIELKKYGEAIEYSKEIDILEEESGYIFYLLGKIYIEKSEKIKAKESLKKSIEVSYKAIEKEKYSKEYNCRTIGKSYYELGKLEENKSKALELYIKAKELIKDEYIEGLNEKLGDTTKEDKYYIQELKCLEKEWFVNGDKAINIFEKIHVKENNEYFLIGKILSKADEYERERKYYKEGLEKEKNPTMINIYFKKIGDTYSNQLETERAHEYYKRSNLLQVASFNIDKLSDKEVSEKYVEAGELNCLIYKDSEAIKSYEKAIGYLNIKENIKELIRCYEKIQKPYENIKDYEAVIKYKFKILELRKAENEKFKMGIIYLEIGEIEELNNDIENAEKYYKKALETFKDLKDINFIIKALEKLCSIQSIKEKYIEELKDIINYDIEI